MYLFFDTETTGLPIKGERSFHPDQPCVVQLACILTDYDGNEIDRYVTLVKPVRFMSEDAFAVHGISYDDAMQNGECIENVAERFIGLAEQADYFCGHNIKFDKKMIRIMLCQAGRAEDAERLADFDTACTMWESMKELKLPRTDGKKGNKWPKLSECMYHFFGQELANAHDAEADIEATKKVFFHLKSMGHFGKITPKPKLDDEIDWRDLDASPVVKDAIKVSEVIPQEQSTLGDVLDDVL